MNYIIVSKLFSVNELVNDILFPKDSGKSLMNRKRNKRVFVINNKDFERIFFKEKLAEMS